MLSNKITIKEIAKMADVSVTAVSFVLNGKGGISEDTKNKILNIIEKTGYHPSAASQSLVTSRSYNIAFIYDVALPPFNDVFYGDIAEGLTEEFTRNKYNVVFIPLLSDDGEFDLPSIIKKKDAGGAVFYFDAPSILLDSLDSLDIPYVLIDWQSPTSNNRLCVNLDSELSMYKAAKYLISKGHKKIAMFGFDIVPQYYVRCLAGYQQALDEVNLPIYPGWLYNSVHDVDTAKEGLKKLMEMHSKPTAICCTNDICAIYILQAAVAMGIKIPEQMSVIGIDDIYLSRFVHPRLTTVSYPKNEIGQEAARLLLKVLSGEEAKSIVINCGSVKERQSVATIS